MQLPCQTWTDWKNRNHRLSIENRFEELTRIPGSGSGVSCCILPKRNETLLRDRTPGLGDVSTNLQVKQVWLIVAGSGWAMTGRVNWPGERNT